MSDLFQELEIEMLKAELYKKMSDRINNLEMLAIVLGRDLKPIDISRAVFSNIEGDNDIKNHLGTVDYNKIIKGSKN